MGSNNNASITQSGDRNVAAIAQIGEGHTRTVNQSGDNLAYGSAQISSDYVTFSHSNISGNTSIGTTLEVEVTSPPAIDD